jgi:site-specific recombinase XerD
LFPSKRIGADPKLGVMRRHHRSAVYSEDIQKLASTHSLRYFFATRTFENGINIGTVQQQIGHSSLETTAIYTHILKRGGQVVRSPLEDI